jgi:hypothetical protein
MGSEKDLINKLLNDQTHITIDDYNSLLNTYGYQLNKGSGSHRIYHKEECQSYHYRCATWHEIC